MGSGYFVELKERPGLSLSILEWECSGGGPRETIDLD